jgi:hypothetical protein
MHGQLRNFEHDVEETSVIIFVSTDPETPTDNFRSLIFIFQKKPQVFILILLSFRIELISGFLFNVGRHMHHLYILQRVCKSRRCEHLNFILLS